MKYEKIDSERDETNPKPDQKESTVEVLERFNKDLHKTKLPEIPRTWINESDHCQSCGS